MAGLSKLILVTGGAGFIGSHVTDVLLQAGHRVRVLDNLDPQVHGSCASWPDYLSSDAERVFGDVREDAVLDAALQSVDVVFHLAAAVGVGQSMYEIARYCSVDVLGTAKLLEAIVRRPIERLIVASSMSIYGEGSYKDDDGHVTNDAQRRLGASLRSWELRDDKGGELFPIATPETKQPDPASVYAQCKLFQEQSCLCIGRAYGVPTVALRFFNVYGPRQSLLNPYTGVIAIFAARLRGGAAPQVYEDGLQQRDFVSVYDVARACRAAMESPLAVGATINIGSGSPVTIKRLAERLAEILDVPEQRPLITGRFRAGDIRHCFADISKARALLGFEPQFDLESGLELFTEWLLSQNGAALTEDAAHELSSRGLSL